MAHSSPRSFTSTMTVFAVAAIAGFCSNFYSFATGFIGAVKRKAWGWIEPALQLAKRDDGVGFGKPAVLLVQARAFVMRIAKRERPVIRAAWRMCPSA